MKAKRSILGSVVVGLVLSIASPALAQGSNAALSASSGFDLVAWLGQLIDRFERPDRAKPGPNRPHAVPELGAQGAAPAVLVALAGGALLVSRRRRHATSV